MAAGKRIQMDGITYVEVDGRLFRVRNAMEVPSLQAAPTLRAPALAPESCAERSPVDRPETRRAASVEIRLCKESRRVADVPRLPAAEVYLGSVSVRAKHVPHRTPVRRMLEQAVRVANG